MNKEIYKFPITPHLTVLGQTVIRDDKVMSKQEVDEFLSHEFVVEEKVDGANLEFHLTARAVSSAKTGGRISKLLLRDNGRNYRSGCCPRLICF